LITSSSPSPFVFDVSKKSAPTINTTPYPYPYPYPSPSPSLLPVNLPLESSDSPKISETSLLLLIIQQLYRQKLITKNEKETVKMVLFPRTEIKDKTDLKFQAMLLSVVDAFQAEDTQDYNDLADTLHRLFQWKEKEENKSSFTMKVH